MPSPLRPLARLFAPTPRTVERETLQIELADGRNIELQRVRDPRARRLKLSVDERGARLTLPMRASLASADRFIAEHRDWLATQLSRYAMDAMPALEAGITTSLPLRGALHAVHWQTGRFTRLDHAVDGSGDLVFAHPARAGDAALRRAARDFYEAQGRADVGQWLPRYLPSLPRAPRRVTFKIMSSQWGSLAPDGSMALDLSLVLARPSAFEYVLVHELCHLIHADHSRAFWREVEARSPHWREEREYFHSEGRRLKATLRALCGKA
ncbi:SprT family zinc-dependent metalloprotease [Lysobacter sp. LF1]|uniref:SprT family zinc-dependent metalloprotease n=1 Tax=Lysobacter stagni TaxID=3045172 RepID=A0ABT6XE31_9GAMM|nr:SprT family zinc-dependent metalloprotease [Lysobacter sp. LF1]MDI9238188.1 SprT family zinc-dependent metalloprotease [Lysobacter sp. LF1]